MTEWWLRKAVICHLSPIFCNYYFVYEGTPDVPTYTLRGERDPEHIELSTLHHHFNSHAPWGA